MTAPLSEAKTALYLDQLITRIAKNLGVTVTKDHNGAWGPAGTVRITLRYRDDSGDLITVSTVVAEISSYEADKRKRQLDAEDK